MRRFNACKTLVLAEFAVAIVVGARAEADGIWTRKADMPTARYGLSASVINGSIYVLGGTASRSAFATVEQYDPATNTWQARASMPVASTGLATSVVDGILYAIGGGQDALGEGRSTVCAYDPASDTWTTRAEMPTPRIVLSASAVDGKIYAVGGKGGHGGGGISTVEEYDPATNAWTRKADMPTPRFSLSCSVVDGKIYAMGGLAYQDGPALKAVEEYDPATDTWTRRSDLPAPSMGLATCALYGRIFAFGGGPTLSAAGGTRVDVYDPRTDAWTSGVDMPTGRLFPAASVVDGKVYVVGGSTQAWPWAGISGVEEYDLTPLPPDFNGDGKVDGEDLLIMTAHWGQAHSLCDIGPIPFGDGVVDLQDVIVLAESMGKAVNDPTLIAHWALDESEGTQALDSAGTYHGAVIGTPTWRPDAGKVGGALEFDRATCVLTDPVLNPGEGPFSVLAWIKGGGPGQVIVSQAGGADWLMVDPATDTLMTDLKDLATRSPTALASQAIVTDGHWHRIALVWDGAHRSLHVDGVEVAADTQAKLPHGDGGMYVGCGQDAAPDTFFTGLIDDVRIYNRAVEP